MDLLNGYSDESSGDEREDESRTMASEIAASTKLSVDQITRQSSSKIDQLTSTKDSQIENNNADSDDDFGPRPAETTLEIEMSTNIAKPTALASGQITEEILESYAKTNKIPIASEVNLTGHTKAVTCISVEPAGNRVVTGSLDYCAKIYDFGGMDSRHRAFQSMEVEDGQPVLCISHSPTGDRFVVATASSQPRVYDRDGTELVKFVKGDMYLRDLAKTKGHTMEVTCVQWHPSEKAIILSSSLDGTLRLWDLFGEATFGMLVNKFVLKTKSTSSHRVGTTSCCFNPTGNRIFGGLADGSIVIFYQKKLYSRPDLTLNPPAIVDNQAVTFLAVSADDKMLVSRYANGKVLLWAIGSHPVSKSPVFLIDHLDNVYPTANLAFSPDCTFLIGCTSAKGNKKSIDTANEDKSRLHFFRLPPVPVAANSSSNPQPMPLNSQFSIALVGEAEAASVSGIAVRWHASTNHIYCSLSSGMVRVLFDATLSTKGALLSTRRPVKRVKDPSDFEVVGEIIAPLALPMFREDSLATKSKKRAMELRDPMIAKIPEKPVDSGPGSRVNTSFFFTQYVTGGKVVGAAVAEDPREALLKYADEARGDPRFLARAYQHTQPQVQLQAKTLEQEQEELAALKKKRIG